MKNYILGAIAMGMVATACGGDDDVLLKDATVAQVKSLCEYSNDHGYAATTCTRAGEEYMLDASEDYECSMITTKPDLPATCTATIGDAKDCIDAISSDPCSFENGHTPHACDFQNSTECRPPETTDDDVLLKDATVAQARSACEYSNDHGYAATTCTVNGDQVMLDASKDLDCSTATTDNVPATCTATIGDYKDCVDAISDDPCSILGTPPPASCAKILSTECSDTTNLTADQRMNVIQRFGAAYGL